MVNPRNLTSALLDNHKKIVAHIVIKNTGWEEKNPIKYYYNNLSNINIQPIENILEDIIITLVGIPIPVK